MLDLGIIEGFNMVEVDFVNDNILESLRGRCKIEKTDANSLFVKVIEEDYGKIAENLKKDGFKRLLTVSAVDWLERRTFEVYFMVHRVEDNLYVKVSTEISRDHPKIDSISHLWINAAMHEREAWELFRITFKGNEKLRPLFLEGWSGLPPFRKDFNCIDYLKGKLSKYPLEEV